MGEKTLVAVAVLLTDDDRLMGFEIHSGKHNLHIVNVYLPYNCPANKEYFLFYLAKINSIIDNAGTSNVMVIWDMNAHTLA